MLFQYGRISSYVPLSPALPVCKPGCLSLTKHKCLVADGHSRLPYLLCGTGFPSFTPVCMARAITHLPPYLPLLSRQQLCREPLGIPTQGFAESCHRVWWLSGGWRPGFSGREGTVANSSWRQSSSRGRSAPLLPAWTDLDKEWDVLVAWDISWYDSTHNRPQYPCCDRFSGITQHCFAFSRLFLSYIMQQEYNVKGLSFTCILQSLSL